MFVCLDNELWGRRQVPDALELSRATFRKIQQNLVWAFAYNCLALPLAAGAFLPRLNLALTPSISGGQRHPCTIGAAGR